MADINDTSVPETPYQRMKRESDERNQRKNDIKADLEEMKAVKQAAEVDTEERRGLIADAGVGLVRAAPGFFEETYDFLATLDEEWAALAGAIDFSNGGYLTPSQVQARQAAGTAGPSILRTPETGLRLIKEMLPEPERFSGQFTEAGAKFFAGFVGGRKLLQSTKLLQGQARTAQLANTMAASGVGDALAFDGHEERLSDLIQSSQAEGGVPDLSNAITEYLASDMNDTELEGRLKTVIEGGILGMVGDAIFAGVRSIKKARYQKAVKETVDKAREAEFTVKEDAFKPEAKKLDEADSTKALDEKVKTEDVEADVKAKQESKEADEVAAKELKETKAAQAFDITPDALAAFRKAVAEGDEDAAFKILDDFNTEKFDWDSIEDADDIYSILRATEKTFAEHIDEVKGGVQSIEKTERLARLVQASGEQVQRLYDDVRGDKGIAARFYAAQKIMLASARELKERAARALEDPSKANEASYIQQAQIHVAIQARIKGSQSEIARTMRIMRESRTDTLKEFHEMDQIRAQFGGGARNSDAFNKHLNELLQTGKLDAINRHVNETGGTKLKNIFVEYVLNGMLSSIKTHAINITSNTLNVGLWTLDRVIANTARGLLGQDAAWRELRIDLYHKMIEIPQAGRLGLQALKEGKPITDIRQRLEFDNRKALTADNLGLDGKSWIGKTVDVAGEIIRVPGRALIAGDEFFKAWTGRTELQVQAFRTADQEAAEKGLLYGKPDYEKYVEKRTVQLLDENNNSYAAVDVREKARQRARQATFQEDALTKTGAAFENALNSNAAIKLLIAPFYRTPMNILRQGILDRTPLGLTIKAHRETIMKGGPEATETIARMTTGAGIMAGLWMQMDGWTEEGNIQIVGKVPYDSSRKTSGVRDYSIRVGDTWYQYNRLDPLGMWLGMMADAHTIASDSEEGASNLLTASTGAFLKNVVNKTWARSLSDLLETIEKIDGGRPATVERAWKKFLAGETGKLIPAIVKSSRDLEGEREALETWGFVDTLSSQLPMHNPDIPKRHDALGRPITWKSGFGSMVNPFSTSPDARTPLDQAMFDMNFTIRPMRKSYGPLELTAKEYSKLTGMVDDYGLTEVLNGLIESDDWEDLSPAMRETLFKKIISDARTTARNVFASDPEFVKRLTDEQLIAINLLAGTDDD